MAGVERLPPCATDRRGTTRPRGTPLRLVRAVSPAGSGRARRGKIGQPCLGRTATSGLRVLRASRRAGRAKRHEDRLSDSLWNVNKWGEGRRARRPGQLPRSAHQGTAGGQAVRRAASSPLTSSRQGSTIRWHDESARRRPAGAAAPAAAGWECAGPIGEAGELRRSFVIQRIARSDRPSVLRSPVANWGNRKGPIGTQGCRTPHLYPHYRGLALRQAYTCVTWPPTTTRMSSIGRCSASSW